MLIDHDHRDLQKPTAEPLLFRLVMLVLVLLAFTAVYLLFARNIPRAMARGLDTWRFLHLFFRAAADIGVPLLGAIGLWMKKERLRGMLLIWLPLEAFFGGRGFARGYTGSRHPDAETLVYAWALYGGFWMLVFMYLMHPKVRLLFQAERAETVDRVLGRKRRLRAGNRSRKSVADQKRADPRELDSLPSDAPDADKPTAGDDE